MRVGGVNPSELPRGPLPLLDCWPAQIAFATLGSFFNTLHSKKSPLQRIPCYNYVAPRYLSMRTILDLLYWLLALSGSYTRKERSLSSHISNICSQIHVDCELSLISGFYDICRLLSTDPYYLSDFASIPLNRANLRMPP